MHYLYDFDDLLWDAIRLENPEQFVSIYAVKGFFEVDETIGSSELRCVLVGYVTYVPVNFKM